VHHYVELIQSALIKTLIGFEHERWRHDPRGVREHPVLGHDRVSFDASGRDWAPPEPAGSKQSRASRERQVHNVRNAHLVAFLTRDPRQSNHGDCICRFVVVVVVFCIGAGVIVVLCEEVVLVLLGVEPQPARTVMPAISAMPTAWRTRDFVSFIVCS
jgi:hypothetical protein